MPLQDSTDKTRTRRIDSGVWGLRVRLPIAGGWSEPTTLVASHTYPDGGVRITHCRHAFLATVALAPTRATRGVLVEEIA